MEKTKKIKIKTKKLQSLTIVCAISQFLTVSKDQLKIGMNSMTAQ